MTPQPQEAFSKLRAWAPALSGGKLRVLKSLPSPPAGCCHEVKSEHLAAGEEGCAGTLHRRACAQVTVPPDMGLPSKVQGGGSVFLSPDFRGSSEQKHWREK